MTGMPIAARELRVASRRRSTYHLRWVPVVLAILPAYSFTAVSSAVGGTAQGRPVFVAFSAFLFGLCLLAGVFFTADCLSQEKREGTLGFLFLSNLTGHDVAFGKFVARAINPVYVLLALLPILGLPVLAGGVSGSEFCRTAAALLNGLLFSLALGLLISAMAREHGPAVTGTALLLGALTVGPPFIALVGGGPASSWPAWISPYTAFSMAADGAYAFKPVAFWGSLLITLALTAGIVHQAGRELHVRWRDGMEPAVSGSDRQQVSAPPLNRSPLRPRRNAEWLERNPVLWLIGNDPALLRFTWLLVLGWGTLTITSSLMGVAGHTFFYLGRVCGFLIKCLLAVQACRFFTEARRTGLWELLLSTSLSNRDILKGQWLALRRGFLPPIAVFLLVHLFPVLVHQVTSTLSFFGIGWELGPGTDWRGSILLNGWFLLSSVADVYAVALLGTWLSISMKQPRYAAMLTILLVLILPAVPFCGFDIFLSLALSLWALRKLRQDLRALPLPTVAPH